MFHKVLGAKSGEYFPMNISIQGNYESIFNNYQTLRMYKEKENVTSMPRNVHQLLNVNLVTHVKAEDEIIENLYNSIINGNETITLGRNEDLVRIEEIKYVQNISKSDGEIINYNAYVPNYICKQENLTGINYRLNTKYVIENKLRKWEKVDVKYIERHTNNIITDMQIEKDEEGDFMFFYNS